VKVPGPVLVKVTFPVGVVGRVLFVSVTVAVQLVELATLIALGLHVMVVVVVCPVETVASSLVVK
jgi:hypothetical protein